ncbi:hypothetical protein F5141DRAFT_1061578 [Pisolithus sp. B1]|nr:hypothetical protein F5141DRAFT_1061578 [Pisolithus sp. B1]
MEGLWCGLLWVFQCSPGQRTSTGKGVEMYEVQLPSEAFTVRDSAERQLEPASEQDLRRAISNRQGSIRAEALYCVSWYRLVYSMKLNLVSKTAILPYRSSLNPLLLSWPPSPSEKAVGATGSSILIIQIELASFLIDHVQFLDVFLVQGLACTRLSRFPRVRGSKEQVAKKDTRRGALQPIQTHHVGVTFHGCPPHLENVPSCPVISCAVVIHNSFWSLRAITIFEKTAMLLSSRTDRHNKSSTNPEDSREHA